uniref:Uncharacterized protein n=1 Tax=viral metagenome TaxID=1070528 RepID=A0A6M3KG25_9ZZZZ
MTIEFEYQSLQKAVDRLVEKLGMEGATMVIENIDTTYIENDPKAILKLRELCLSGFSFEGRITEDSRSNTNLANSRRAFAYMGVKQLRMKPDQIQRYLKTKSLATIYNYIRDVEHYMDNEKNFQYFITRYDLIKEQYNQFIQSQIKS